ncbi:PEGA domain-containing protein [Candidatus Chrysopegis kryptomonas]|uniref:PEGA domain-containing protein n=1 Tax=Candidatus Chryseopegocella kryptomonas TaxID=1633643 RepID=A0A0P1MLG2_9BACT|nr:PEGA domain-containing protein [Candidatus Chrysopegis kryptomonas]CUS96301.1 PEGA domain-containing protein [Candidatus Chrysopegis kryptomonas]
MRLILALIFFLFTSISLSQESYGILNIDSEIHGASVFIDSQYVGLTPISNFKIKPGTYALKLKNPQIADWLEQDVVQKVEVKAGDTLNLFITFEKFIKINSIPFSAEILLGDSVIGLTPSVFKLREIFGKRLRIKKQGYDEAEILIDGKTTKFEINLVPKKEAEAELRTERRSRLNVALPIAGISLANGILSIYFKSKADALYNEYVSTGDPEKLNKMKQYDKIAGITLVIFELTAIIAIYTLMRE